MRTIQATEPACVIADDGSPPPDFKTVDAISKLRLPRKLLEKWVEEPFFDEAVVGCFVRLGVGKAPGSRGVPQYRICEVIGVVDYKYSYAFGEFQTKKALMLRIGRSQRLWRMNVISNHRFTRSELEEWRSTLMSEHIKLPDLEEIDKRKARMREAIFGHERGGENRISEHREVGTRYSEADVARLVDARRKRNEAAHFRERPMLATRLNHGQTRTHYEHDVRAARDAYAALLLVHCNRLRAITPELQVAMKKVEEQDLNTLLDNGACEKNLDALATKLVEIQHEQLDSSVIASLSEDYRAARKLLSETLQRLNDFRKNAFDLRTKRDTEAPSRTSALHLINETKKQENALADMAYGQKKQQDESHLPVWHLTDTCRAFLIVP